MIDLLDTVYEPDSRFQDHIKRMAERFQQWPQWKKDMVGYKEAIDANENSVG